MQNLIITESYLPFFNRLQKVKKHLGKIAKKKNVTCYRLYDKDIPQFPFCIDLYEKNVVVYEYKTNYQNQDYDLWIETCASIIRAVLAVPEHHLYMKMRKKKEHREDQYQKLSTENNYAIVHENDHQFYVNFTDFLDTGLFLDHRPTRKIIQEKSANKKILNLFCYTASFSIYAAKGNASEVWSMDLSNTYMDWGKRNALLNNLPTSCTMHWLKGDVLQEIDKLPTHHFDIIILDPPTFSNSKMMDTYWDVQEHHAVLLQKLHNLLLPNGEIYFSTNCVRFVLDIPAIENHFTIKNIKGITTDFDFQDRLRRECFLLTKK